MPKLIHGLWHDTNLPAKCFVDSWRAMNPEAQVRIWTFADAAGLMREHLPHLVPLHDSMPFLLQRANLLRMVVLHQCGGIYLDLDMECLRPLDRFFDEALLFGNTRDPGFPMVACNAILGARHPHDSFWEEAFNRMAAISQDIRRDTDAIKTTGALFLTDLLREKRMEHLVYPQPVFFPKPGQCAESFTIHHTARPAWVGRQYIDGHLVDDRSEAVSGNVAAFLTSSAPPPHARCIPPHIPPASPGSA